MRLHGCRLSERLMRPAGVAEAIEPGQLDVEGAHAQLTGAGLRNLQWPAALAHDQARMQHSFETGKTALNSLIAKPTIDGDARVVDLHHLAGLSPAGTASSGRA